VIADKVYPDERCVPSGGNADTLERINRIRACHETINRRFKEFGILGSTFRHDRALHADVFHAIANIAQVALDHGHPLFAA